MIVGYYYHPSRIAILYHKLGVKFKNILNEDKPGPAERHPHPVQPLHPELPGHEEHLKYPPP